MKARSLNPVQIAFKYDPPTLALVYTLNGPKRFLHEFPFREDDLLSTSEEVYNYFLLSHPGYLDKVSPDQVLRLIEQVQNEWVEEDPQAQQMQEFLRDMRSKMTEEEYEDFIAKVQSGEIVLGGEEEEEYEEEFEDEPDNDRY